MVGDPKFGRRSAVLAVADGLAVHPHVCGGADAVEYQEDFPAVPLLRNRERVQIRSDRVVLMWNERRVSRKRVRDVEIVRNPVSLDLPTPRHINLSPGTRVEPRLHEIERPVRRLPHPVESPASVQRLVPRRLVAIHGQCGSAVGERDECGVRTFLIDVEHCRVFPVGNAFRMLVRA